MTVNCFDVMYAGGAWRKMRALRFLDLPAAATDAPSARLSCCSVGDVDIAVKAAARAFPGWSVTPFPLRLDLLRKLGNGIDEKSDILARAMTEDIGVPIRFSRQVQVGIALRDLDAIISCDKVFTPFSVGAALVRREPVGVVAGITPWNFPLHQMVIKVASALAAGCTIVLKPSEYASRTAKLLADILHDVGTPEGVFNLVYGDGETGMALASHAAVDVVSFTGSQRTGRAVAIAAAGYLKRTVLELGGKSANIILPDADLSVALPGAVEQCFANSGQFCASLSRLLVPVDSLEVVEARIPEIVKGWALGNPEDENTRLGPLVSRIQQSQVREHITAALADGAKRLVGGPEQPADFPVGAYVQPTVLSRVKPNMRIAHEETFGPVLAILTYRDEADAIRIANDSSYGLSGGVWSGDVMHALNVADRLYTGQVVINGAPLDVAAPFGGVRKSGWGREYGRFGIEELTFLKSLLGGNHAEGK